MSVRRLQNHNDDNGDNGSDAVTPVSGLGLPTQGWSVCSGHLQSYQAM